MTCAWRLIRHKANGLHHWRCTSWALNVLVAAWAIGVVLLASQPVEARFSEPGIAPNVISLPSGSGSIDGLGNSFQPDLNTGSASLQINFRLPPGRGGFAPELALSYSSGGSNGIFGLGWGVNIPFVQRQTEKGLPHYTLWPKGNGMDDDNDGEIDDYDEFDTIIYGNKEELIPLPDGYWRLKNESQFIRFRKRKNGWRATSRDGTVLEFGSTGNSRVAKAERVFRWHLDRMVDLNGNVITFEYKKLDDTAQRYIWKIIYNQTDSAAMTVEFVYEPRPDVFTDYRPRFELKTTYRCTGVGVFAAGKAVRSYSLAYSSVSSWRPLSLLTSVTETGRDGKSSLPPMRFGYTGAEYTGPDLRLLAQAPVNSLTDQNIGFLDINADGLPDIIDTNQQPHAYYLNKGVDDTEQVRWANSAQMDNSVGVYLGAKNVRFSDMNGDGRTDLVIYDGQAIHYYSNMQTGKWHREKPIPGSQFVFSDPNVKLLDINHDQRIDVIQSAGQEVFTWINQNDGTWSGRYIWPIPDEQLQFDRATTVFADMNGDRLLDLVYVAPSAFHYYPAKGFGEFGKKVVMRNAPERIIDPSRVLIVDVNSDGRSDLIYLGASLDVWLNQGLDVTDNSRGILAAPISVQSSLLDASMPFRQADVNGNGSIDILWNTSLNGQVQLAYADFSPTEHPNLLHFIDNGVGGRTRIHYSTSVRHMVRATADGRPWSQTTPFVVSVVTAKEVKDGRRSYRSEYVYRDGYYDSLEKEFQGFAEVVVTEIGDATVPHLITTHSFKIGEEVETLKGKLLTLETRDSDNRLFFREQHVWDTKVLAEGVAGDSRQVTYAFQSTKRLDVYEGKPVPVSTQWDYENDDFGNLTRVVEHGRLDQDWADERVTETVYTSSFQDGRDKWILDRIVKQETLDRSGNRVAGERRYFDGNAALGAIGTGNLTRVEHLVSGTQWVDWLRKDYDSFGNVTAIYDGEYREPSAGHFRKVYYDPEFSTYPVREVVYTGNPSAPQLEIQTTYDPGFGLVTSHTDANSNQTDYAYDPFGRLIAVVRPGDSSDAPTEAYEYVLGFDAGNGVTVNWVEMRQREQAGGGSVDTRKFYDGLGRRIMTRKESETPGQIVVSGVVRFNSRNLPWRRVLPFSEHGTMDFAMPPDTVAFVEYHYDALGRTIRLTQPDGSFSTTGYEPYARIVRDEEQTREGSAHEGAARRFIYDGLWNAEGIGRLREVHEIVKVTDDGSVTNVPVAWITAYDYDLLDNVVQITDAQGNRKLAAFDGLGRKILDNDPNRGIKRYEYDAASNLIATVDAKGQRITYDFDGANRLVAEDFHDTGRPFSADRHPDVRYVYDHSAINMELVSGRQDAPRNTLGRLVSVYDPSGESHVSYDPRGRVVLHVKGIPHKQTGVTHFYTSILEYDSLDRVTAFVYPDGDRIGYTYNSRGLLERIMGTQGLVVANINYHPSGQVIRKKLGNGVTTIFEYDERLRLIRLSTRKPGEAPLLAYAYRRDNVSNMVGIDDLRQLDVTLTGATPRINDQEFAYDDAYRLTRVLNGLRKGGRRAKISYRYDRIGNLLEKSSNLEHEESAHHATNPGHFDYQGGRTRRSGRTPGSLPGPHAATGASNRRMLYDDNGNVVQLDGQQLTWNFKDRLASVISDRATTTYVYDHAGRRVTKHVKSNDADSSVDSTVLYVNPAYEIRDGTPVKYVYANNQRVARMVSEQVSNDSIKTDSSRSHKSLRYYHPDHLGSTDVLTDGAGGLVADFAYSPFGHPRRVYPSRTPEMEPYQFSQKELDNETRLQYFEARYLDGTLGRFLSVDPALANFPQALLQNPQQLNAYSYAMNRPLLYQDPTGSMAIAPLLLIGGSSLLGGSVSVGIGYSFSKAVGSDYSWTNFAIDFGMGAIPGAGGAAIGHRVYKLARISRGMDLPKYSYSSNLYWLWGETLPTGEVILSTKLLGRPIEHMMTLRHEAVHALFTPMRLQTNLIARYRQKLRMWGYHNSFFLRYAEEALAQGIATRSLREGLSFPLNKITYRFISKRRIFKEVLQTSTKYGATIYLGSKVGSRIYEK